MALLSSRREILAGMAIILVVGVIAAALRVVGPPGEARLLAIDERRVVDLQQISSAVEQYYVRQNERLPATLDEVATKPDRTLPTRDPETAAAYLYRVVDANAYELCADFARASSDEAVAQNGFWVHPAGPHCFRITTP